MKRFRILFFGALIMGNLFSCKASFELSPNNWLNDNVPSFSKNFEKYFQHVGIAVTYENELSKKIIQDGLKKHTNSITMGNEFKPDFVFNNWEIWPKPNLDGRFTDSDGKNITVPSNVPNWNNKVDNCLQICKDLGIQMRGHVLLWHSQTPAWFFHEDFDKEKPLVDKSTMNARLEWYIKTLVEHVQDWEKKNNNGKHIVWAWDVANEAASDGATTDDPRLRNAEEGSKWFEIYGDESFLIQAFRYANKYVSKDVELCYNDYNCVYDGKRSSILKILDSIIAHKNDLQMPTRINAMGMQSHISKNTKVTDFEKAIKDFLTKDIDVQITELDIATEEKYDPQELAEVYKKYFEMFIKNRKTEKSKGISAVTVWGINDETTWLNSPDQIKWHGNVKQYPLLFELNSSGEMVTKKAFDEIMKIN